MKKTIFTTVVLALLIHSIYSQTYNWSTISGAPYNAAKQDGIYFINKDTGWVVNGSGKIFKTQNGGTNWLQQKNSPGTYFRCVAFINNQIGFAGNVGTNYFPGVTDTNPLYKTIDGGNSWSVLTASITGVIPTGVCAIQVVNSNVIYAAGRVGGPPVIVKSIDGGNNWVGTDLSSQCSMILDVYFHSSDTGYVFAGSDSNIANAVASILRTTDGGLTWSNVYTSSRTYEIMWKAWFPSHEIGYATIQSYDSGSSQRYIAKTTDGGLTWFELPLVNLGIREFGIGFANDTIGWVGGETTGYQTLNGGSTWTNKNIGQYANKFSIVNNTNGTKTCYAVGLNVTKTTGIPTLTVATSIDEKDGVTERVSVYPNPSQSGAYVSISLEKLKTKIIKAELISADGKASYLLFDTYYLGTHESPFLFKLPQVTAGKYVIKFVDEKNEIYSQNILVVN